MSVVRKKQDDRNLKALRELGTLPGNRFCFDCGQRGPTYINLTIGSFVCSQCSGALRGLTPPHRVKSISMATFTQDEIEYVRAHGNDECAKTWLGLSTASGTAKGGVGGANGMPQQDYRDLIIDKYEKRRYYLEQASPLKSIGGMVAAMTTAASTGCGGISGSSSSSCLSSSSSSGGSNSLSVTSTCSSSSSSSSSSSGYGGGGGHSHQMDANNMALKAITLTTPPASNRAGRSSNHNQAQNNVNNLQNHNNNNNNTVNGHNNNNNNNKSRYNNQHHPSQMAMMVNGGDQNGFGELPFTSSNINGQLQQPASQQQQQHLQPPFGSNIVNKSVVRQNANQNNNHNNNNNNFVYNHNSKVGVNNNSNGVNVTMPLALKNDNDFVADFNSADIFNAANQQQQNVMKNGSRNGVGGGVGFGAVKQNNGGEENWADFEHNVIFNSAGLPMTSSSNNNNNNRGGTAKSSSFGVTPSSDRYAALKDLDEQLRETKEKETQQQQQQQQPPVNMSIKTNTNPFKIDEQQPQLQHQVVQQAGMGAMGLNAVPMFYNNTGYPAAAAQSVLANASYTIKSKNNPFL